MITFALREKVWYLSVINAHEKKWSSGSGKWQVYREDRFWRHPPSAAVGDTEKT
jgi:hypothetical protein